MLELALQGGFSGRVAIMGFNLPKQYLRISNNIHNYSIVVWLLAVLLSLKNISENSGKTRKQEKCILE